MNKTAATNPPRPMKPWYSLSQLIMESSIKASNNKALTLAISIVSMDIPNDLKYITNAPETSPLPHSSPKP